MAKESVKYKELLSSVGPQLEKDNLHARFYYEKENVSPKNEKILYTVCLLVDKNSKITARGISICSLMDPFNRIKGRNKALGRALKAFNRKDNSEPILPQNRTKNGMSFKKLVSSGEIPNWYPVLVASKMFSYKSEWSPIATKFETKLLSKPEEKK